MPAQYKIRVLEWTPNGNYPILGYLIKSDVGVSISPNPQFWTDGAEIGTAVIEFEKILPAGKGLDDYYWQFVL